MRIKELKIHNIASIADAEIDFCSEELSSSSVILISGETGAGKSTLLDAICLALYASTPRMTSAAHEELAGSTDNRLKFYANDNAQLLRRGAGEGFVKLIFEGNDGEDYEAVWAVQRDHKKPHKKLQKPTRSLRSLTANSFYETHKKRVEEKILEITGLDYEQFCRTVMLAQGEFTKFLKSKRNEKSQILEKLTGTEIYSEIGKKIAERFLHIKYDWELLKNEIDKVTILTDDELEALRKSLLTHNDEIKVAKHIRDIAKEKINWITEYQKLKVRQQKIHESLTAAENLIRDSGFIKDKETVNDFYRTVIPRKLQQDIQKGKVEVERQELLGAQIINKLQILTEQVAVKEKELKEWEEKIVLKEKEIETLNIKDVNQKMRDLNEKKLLFSSFLGALERFDTIEKLLEEIRIEKEGIQGKIQKYSESLLTAQKDLLEADKRKEEAIKNYDRLFLSTSEAAKRLRSAIHKGDPCPVCGEIVMKELDNGMFEKILLPFKVEKQEAEEFYRKKDATVSSTKKIIIELSSTLTNLKERYVSTEHEYSLRKQEVANYCVKSEIQADNTIELRNSIIEKRDLVENEINYLVRYQKLHVELSEQLKSIRSKANSFRNETETIKIELQNINSAHTKWEVSLNEKKTKIDEDEQTFKEFFNTHPEIEIKRVEELGGLSETYINSIKERIDKTESMAHKERGALENIEKEILKTEQSKPQLNEEDTIEFLKEHQNECDKRIEELSIRIGEITEKLKNNDNNLFKLKQIIKDEERKREEKEKWELLYKTLGDTDGAKFRGAAQSLILKSLLDNANAYMETFTDRYYLTCNPGSLTILVIDRLRPSEPQPASILSGGESFMASLSLALALSNLKGGGMNVDIIFIDEGFGTLSSEYLGNVMETLEKLHQVGGKKVGLISHVPELKERIPLQINVYRESPTLSKVKIERI